MNLATWRFRMAWPDVQTYLTVAYPQAFMSPGPHLPSGYSPDAGAATKPRPHPVLAGAEV